MKNPWLTIPADDYEGHMSSKNVRQLQTLNRLFKEAMLEFSPQSLCILGCTTGNGFEHINTEVTRRIVAIDINERYLNIIKDRFGTRIPYLELVCGDIVEIDLPDESFDLIYAGLFFEYVDVESTMTKISCWLKTGGMLCFVLQLSSETSSVVSETGFDSLGRLSTAINLVDADFFTGIASKLNLNKIKTCEEDLKTGKKFFVGHFKKMPPRTEALQNNIS